MDREFEFVVNLDGDLSHDPADIAWLLATGTEADLVVGARSLGGIRVINWPLHRLMISVLAARYVRVITGIPVHDPASGFRCFRRDALKAILGEPVISTGYSLRLEMLHEAWQRSLRIAEVQILFTDRRHGQTKMNYGIVLEAMWLTRRILLQTRCRRCPLPHHSAAN